MFHTGDLARYFSDPNIGCKGRFGRQMKYHSLRIELQDIEKTLRQHDAIKDCYIKYIIEDSTQQYLVAYIVCIESISSLTLRQYLKQRLPKYMIPSKYIQLDRIPLLANGKVDVQSLESKTTSLSIEYQYFKPPEKPIEKKIAEIWQELLDTDKVGLKDNFFDIGGYSLLAIKMIQQVAQATGFQIKFRDLLYQTLEQLVGSCSNSTLEDNKSHII